MNQIIQYALLFLLVQTTTIVSAQTDDSFAPEEWVNPLMGTDSKFDLSNGNTYPAIALPWGMNFWTPMTSKMGDGWTYKYNENKIRGFKQTHQPSPWINDYAAFSLMPVSKGFKFTEEGRQSWYSHKAEEVHPYYYSVYLADYDIKTEITPTERAAHFQFTFPESDSSYIILDGFDMGSMVKIIPEENKIIGYCRNNHGGVPDNFHNYFVAVFDKPFEANHTWKDNWTLAPNTKEQTGEHVGAIVHFKTKRGEKVNVRVASSFISLEQAELNLQREIGNQNFETTHAKGKEAWNKELSKILVSSDNDNQVRTFYSCLYRLLLFPRSFYEYNSDNKVLHYSPYNGQIEEGYMFTDNGFWDTFRAVFPFFTLMYPELNAKIMQGLVNAYEESGWLPEWASPGHRDCMIGSNSSVLISDAYIKGITDFDADILMEAMLKNANVNDGRPENSVGRAGVDYYNELGYVPYDVGINENAARSLEYAYADFTLAQMASKMNKKDISKRFYKQSYNYKKLYDPETGWMRGKKKDGNFMAPFNPLKWGDAFTEGNSLHYTWSVFQDIDGLIELMGGENAFAQKLDDVFEMPPNFDDSYYGFTIHEIREMQIVNMGNYAHGNQPIQHMIYLYNHARQPWKAQEKVRNVIDNLYTPNPDGYCGDEDNGQTSAWYVFSALGFYPVTPGTTEYVIGSPAFDHVKMTMPTGKTLEIKAENQGKKNVYIESMSFENQLYNRTWLDHHTLQNGGLIEFRMSDQPNKNWGVDKSSKPFSLSTSDIKH